MPVRRPSRRFVCAVMLICAVSAPLPLNAAAAPSTGTACTPSCVGDSSSGSTAVAPLVIVPTLTDLTLNEVRKSLSGVGLTLGQVSGATSDPATTVSAQKPNAGAAVAAGQPVDVTLGPATSEPVVTPSRNRGGRVLRGSTGSASTRPIVTTTARPATVVARASKSLGARYGGIVVVALVVVLLAAGLVGRILNRRRRRRIRRYPVARVDTRVTGVEVGMRSLGPPPGPPTQFRTTSSSTLAIRRKP